MPGPHGRSTGPASTTTTGARPEPTPPTVDQAVDQVFTRLDGNANGQLTLAEILAVLDPQGTRTTVSTAATALVTALDVDRSGGLSKAEVKTLLAKLDSDADGLLERSDRSATNADAAAFEQAAVLLHHGGGRGPGHGDGPRGAAAEPTVEAATTALWTRFDTDGNQSISLAELVAQLDPRGRHTDLQTKLTALLPAADTNGDQALSRTELSAALTRADADADGTLERAELHPASGATDLVQLVGVLLHGDCFGG